MLWAVGASRLGMRRQISVQLRLVIARRRACDSNHAGIFGGKNRRFMASSTLLKKNVETDVSLIVWDRLESHLAELLFDQGMNVRCAVPAVCQRHPDASVHHLALALVSVSSAMEDTWPVADVLNQRSLLDLYRATAAVLADLSAHGLTRAKCETCGDILAHWCAGPESFFDVSGISG